MVERLSAGGGGGKGFCGREAEGQGGGGGFGLWGEMGCWVMEIWVVEEGRGIGEDGRRCGGRRGRGKGQRC